MLALGFCLRVGVPVYGHKRRGVDGGDVFQSQRNMYGRIGVGSRWSLLGGTCLCCMVVFGLLGDAVFRSACDYVHVFARRVVFNKERTRTIVHRAEDVVLAMSDSDTVGSGLGGGE